MRALSARIVRGSSSTAKLQWMKSVVSLSQAHNLSSHRMFRFQISALTLVAPALLGLIPVSHAQSTRSEAALVSKVASIKPGEPFTVALSLVHPDGWHSYYQNTGGVELPPSIKWNLPDGFTAGAIQWPTPKVKDGPLGQSFIYEGNPVFLIELTPPANVSTGTTVTLEAEAHWQICKLTCIDESRTLSLSLPVAETSKINPAAQALFAKALASMPLENVNAKFAVESAEGDLMLTVSPASVVMGAPTDFIPNEPFILAASAGGSITPTEDGWNIRLKRATVDVLDRPIPQGNIVSGILLADGALAIPPTNISAPAPKPLSFGDFLPVLGGMFLGGLILNLMPCVFPVIGLKIMGFVQQAGSDRRKIVLHGLIFALGVLASFAVLSGILFFARQAAGGGASVVGWGYQLQNPWVVFSLMLLMFVLGLSMYGVFELGTSATSVGGNLQSKQGMSGTFFSGVLATVVATPCSAPFLGAAIGAAIALPALQFFTAFAAMAVGLSTPYLVLSTFPSLIDKLPRPGPWMESFKQAMSFLLFATAGYLLWVYAGQIGLENLLGPIFGLSAIAIAAWIHGRWNLPHRPKQARAIALTATLAFALAGFLLCKPPKPSLITWEPWSEQRQAELLEEGKPVYVDFTAQWCATCQVNKKRAYTKEVVALMKEKGVVALKADKTKPNPDIEAALQRYGRTAIPVNVLLTPDKDPLLLPELLSPDDVRGALKDL
jgi:thiol:disulfide interchange protein DsbD